MNHSILLYFYCTNERVLVGIVSVGVEPKIVTKIVQNILLLLSTHESIIFQFPICLQHVWLRKLNLHTYDSLSKSDVKKDFISLQIRRWIPLNTIVS